MHTTALPVSPTGLYTSNKKHIMTPVGSPGPNLWRWGFPLTNSLHIYQYAYTHVYAYTRTRRSLTNSCEVAPCCSSLIHLLSVYCPSVSVWVCVCTVSVCRSVPVCLCTPVPKSLFPADCALTPAPCLFPTPSHAKLCLHQQGGNKHSQQEKGNHHHPATHQRFNPVRHIEIAHCLLSRTVPRLVDGEDSRRR